MKRARFGVIQRIEMLGVPGIVGIGVSVFTLVFGFAALLPAVEQLDELRDREARVLERRLRAEREPSAAPPLEAGLDRFMRWLPKADDARQEMLRLQTVADRHGLQLKSGEYRAVAQNDLPVIRHQVLVPVKGAYANLRGFVTEALDELPALALDVASLQRDAVTAKEIEGRLQFSLYTAGS